MYSKWRKVDLHIHTDKSKETKEKDYKGVFDVEVLFQKLLENNIEMISLTDHNIINIDAYNKITEKDIAFLLAISTAEISPIKISYWASESVSEFL